MRRRIRNDLLGKKWKTPSVASHCRELEKRLGGHRADWTRHQQTIQSQERLIASTQARLPVLQLAMAKTIERILTGDEWVTAEEHSQIYSLLGEAIQERDTLRDTLKTARAHIAHSARQAEWHAGHAIGIERALHYLQCDSTSDPLSFPPPAALTHVH